MTTRRAPGWTTASPRRRNPRAGAPPTLATWLLLAALVLRALIPAGYMLNPQGGAAAPFMLCTGIHDGVSRMLSQPDGVSRMVSGHADHIGHGHHGSTATDDSHEAVGPCAFGALAALILPPLTALPSRRRIIAHRWRRVRHRHLPRQRAPGDPGARAPPRAA